MKLNSIYVGVENMTRAVRFYEVLFGCRAADIDDRFSVFDLHGVSFCLYDASKDGDKMVFGNNCVPDFEVEDIEKEYGRIESLGGAPLGEIQSIGGLKIFQFRDPEGNIIELYEG